MIETTIVVRTQCGIEKCTACEKDHQAIVDALIVLATGDRTHVFKREAKAKKEKP